MHPHPKLRDSGTREGTSARIVYAKLGCLHLPTLQTATFLPLDLAVWNCVTSESTARRPGCGGIVKREVDELSESNPALYHPLLGTCSLTPSKLHDTNRSITALQHYPTLTSRRALVHSSPYTVIVVQCTR